MSRLFSLFDDRLRTQRDLVSGPKQTLESISSVEDEQEFALKKIREFEQVKPKVDYSDFSNFVFFNSALAYFNITGEKILNEYPYDGSRAQLQAFLDDLDDYQKHVVSAFPKRSGHLRLSPASGFAYVKVDDVGRGGGITGNTAALSPGTGSLTVEFWCEAPPALTGTEDIMVAIQKVSGSNQDGYTVYFSGSSAYFRVTSGSVTDQVSVSARNDRASYYACVFDAASSQMRFLTGSSTEFPVVVASSSLGISERIDLGTVPLYMGSGSLGSKRVRSFTGSLDNVRIWKTARSTSDVSGTFNVKSWAIPGLVGMWTFNETGSIPNTASNPENAIVKDRSGNRLDARITNYYPGIRASGSLIPYDVPDLILSLATPELQSYVLEQQTSGSNYDRQNDHLITRSFPEQYFLLEEDRGTDVFEKFIYIIARSFDQIKVRVDQYLNVLRQNYGQHNQTPDALLADVGRFFGWEFAGNFLSADVNQYVLGKNILRDVEYNRELDTKLYEIKNAFWRRTLLNLAHIYKTKGTRDSVESLLRIYGANKHFVRLKEFGLKPRVGISTQRIHAEKSVPALTFGSASHNGAYLLSTDFTSSVRTVECLVKFPTTSSTGMTASIPSGTIWTLSTITASDGFPYEFPFAFGEQLSADFFQLYYEKAAISSYTGTLFLSSSEGSLQITGTTLWDNNWHNIAFIRDVASGSMSLQVRTLDVDSISYFTTASLTESLSSNSDFYVLQVGATASQKAEFWLKEVRVWDNPLEAAELDDHCFNFQSYGTRAIGATDSLALHWRLSENVTASDGGKLNSEILDVSLKDIRGSGHNFKASDNPYRRFLMDYNYIAPPDHGWTEDLVRILPSTEVKPADALSGNRLLALEFNMIDALNEDISQILSTLDGFNEHLGLPVNRYRDQYDKLEDLRSVYFKRLQGRLNFRTFADMLEFFDRSFIDMVRKLIPARAIFLGDQFVVESHMLERPKHQWEYRRQDLKLEIEGRIRMTERQ